MKCHIMHHKIIYCLWVVLIAFLSSFQAIAGIYDNNVNEQCNSVFSTPSSRGCSSANRGGYKTIEEARFALRNALLEYSQECKTTNVGFYKDAKCYNEVVGYVVQYPDGSYGISRLVEGSEHQVDAAKPDGAVESMHTHPWWVDYKDGNWINIPDSYTGLGPSGQDIQTAQEQGIPAFVLDCASGDVYGVSSDRRALKMVCDEGSATCRADSMTGKAENHIIARGPWAHLGLPAFDLNPDFSQQVLDARYQEHLQNQQNTSQTGRPENSVQTQPINSETDMMCASQDDTSGASSVSQSYETIDYRPVKNWATETINSAYSQATGIADSEGFGAEYRSTVAPIVNQGLNYIQSIPDQVQVPVGQ